MVKFRLKNFSIQDGGYKGGKYQPVKANYAKGAGLGASVGAVAGVLSGMNKGNTIGGAALGLAAGAGIGAFIAWMREKCDQSIFNSGKPTIANSYTLIQELEELYATYDPDNEEVNVSRTQTDSDGNTFTVARKTTRGNKTGVVAKGTLYTVNEDPNKCTISAYYSAGVLVLYVNRPKNHELSFLNKILDKYCYSYKNADYTATQIRNNVYEVEVAIVAGTETDICEQLVDSGFCLNIMTTNKF